MPSSASSTETVVGADPANDDTTDRATDIADGDHSERITADGDTDTTKGASVTVGDLVRDSVVDSMELNTAALTQLAHAVTNARVSPRDALTALAPMLTAAIAQYDDRDETQFTFLRVILPTTVRAVVSNEPRAADVPFLSAFLKAALRCIIARADTDIAELWMAAAHILGAPIHSQTHAHDARTGFYASAAASAHDTTNVSPSPPPSPSPSSAPSLSAAPLSTSAASATLSRQSSHALLQQIFPVVRAAPSDVDVDAILVNSRRTRMQSTALMENIRHFVEFGGLQTILQRLNGDGADVVNTSAAVTLHMLSALVEMRLFIAHEFALDYALRLKDALFEHILRWSDEVIKAATRKSFDRILTLVDALLSVSLQATDIAEMLECFELRFALKLIRCKYLDKRIAGMNDIREVIDGVTRKEDILRKNRVSKNSTLGYLTSALSNVTNEPALTQSSAAAMRLWMSGDYLLNFLTSNALIELVLQPKSTHSELIKRLTPILAFVAANNALTEEHIELLWSFTTSEQHESIEHLIYDIIAKLVAHIPATSAHLISLIIKKCSARQLRTFDIHLVDVVDYTTLAALKLADGSASETLSGGALTPVSVSSIESSDAMSGLSILCLLAMPLPSDGVNGDVQIKAERRLLSLLALEFATRYRQALIDKFVAQIRLLSAATEQCDYTQLSANSLSINHRLSLVRSIIRTYPAPAGKGWFSALQNVVTQSHVIAQLDISSALIHLLIADMTALYKRTHKHDALNDSEAAEQNDAHSLHTVYVSSVGVRLDFLAFLLSTCNLTVSREQMDVLWFQFVDCALAGERDVFYQWIIDVCPSPTSSESFGLSTEMAEYVFANKILRSQAQSMSVTAFNMLYAYLTLVNVKSGNVRVDESVKPANASNAVNVAVGRELIVMTSAAEVLGTGILWEIALKHDDDVVAHRAIRLVNALQMANARSRLTSSELVASDGHLKQTLNFLSSAVAINSPQSAQMIARCVSMLKLYLSGLRRRHDVDTGIVIRVIPTRDFRVEPFDVQVERGQTVADVRRIVFDKLRFVVAGLNSKSLRLRWEDKTLVSPHITLHSIGIRNGDVIVVRRLTDSFNLLIPSTAAEQSTAAQHAAAAAAAAAGQSLDELAAATVQAIPVGYPRDSLIGRPIKLSSNTRRTANVDGVAADAAAFDRLMELLLLRDSAMSSDVWDIIMLMPTPQQYYHNAIALNAEFQKQLSHRNLYHLLYALYVVEDVLTEQLPDDVCAAHATFDVSMWTVSLIKDGYLQRLINTLCDAAFQLYNRDRHGPKLIWYLTSSALMKLIHDVFTFDAAYDAAPSQQYDIHLAKGSLVSNRGFDTLTLRLVCEAVIPSAISTERDITTDDTTSDDENDDVAGLRAARLSKINCALRLLHGAVHHSPTIIESVVVHSLLDDFLRILLIQVDDDMTRLHAAKVVFLLIKNAGKVSVEHRRNMILTVIRIAYWSPPKTYRNRVEHFFELVSDLVDGAIKSKVFAVDGTMLDEFSRLQEHLTKRIKAHQTAEAFGDYAAVDVLLVSYLRLLRTLYSYEPLIDEQAALDLAKFVYSVCIMSLPSAESPGCLCRSLSSRPAAYALLIELAMRAPSVFSYLLRTLCTESLWLRRRDEWSYEPLSLDKANSVTAVGLINQGCTCYMNAFLQQLYHIRPFRKIIFQCAQQETVAAGATPSSPRNGSAPAVAAPLSLTRSSSSAPPTPLIPLLQNMFAHLQLSHKTSYDTLTFARSLRDGSGAVLNLNEQRDVNEFGGMIFDQLETEMKSAGAVKSEFDSLFKGAIMNQMISRECPHTSEREEPFYMISLTVKNKRTLKQALDNFIEGDLLDDTNKWICNECNQRVSALKRTCFHQTPNYLFLHLKRFEFDFDAMKKVKINDFFEFPMDFDMEPYTRQALSKTADQDETPSASSSSSPWLYRLVGIIVHSGVADAGHYYAFLQTEVDGAGDSGEWIELNDDRISPFDPDLIPTECFGGVESMSAEEIKIRSAKDKQQIVNIRNAYMLIYQRRDKQEIVEPSDGQSASTDVSDERSECAESSDVVASLLSDGAVAADIASLIALPLATSIRRENMIFLEDKFVFDAAFTTFVWNLLHVKQEHKHVATINGVNGTHKPQLPIAAPVLNSDAADSSEQTIVDVDETLSDKMSATLSSDDQRWIAQLTTHFTFKLLVRSVENGSFVQWTEFMTNLFDHSWIARVWFLNALCDDDDWAHIILFSCPHAVVRAAFAQLIAHVIRTHRKDENERALYATDTSSLEANTLLERSASAPHDRTAGRSPIIRVFRLVLSWIASAKKFYKTFSAYFRLILAICQCGDDERRWLMENGIVGALIRFYCDDETLIHFNTKPINQGEPPKRVHPTNAAVVIRIIANLVHHALHDKQRLDALPSADRELLFDGLTLASNSKRIPFIPFALRDPVAVTAAMNIAVDIAVDDENVQHALMHIALRLMTADMPMPTLPTVPSSAWIQGADLLDEFESGLILFNRVVNIGDAFHQSMIDRYVPKWLAIIRAIQLGQHRSTLHPRTAFDTRYVQIALRHLITLARQSPAVATHRAIVSAATQLCRI